MIRNDSKELRNNDSLHFFGTCIFIFTYSCNLISSNLEFFIISEHTSLTSDVS